MAESKQTRHPKHSLSRRVFTTVFITAMVLIVATTVAGAVFIQRTLADTTRSELANESHMVAEILNTSNDDLALLRSLNRENTRITLIAEDGDVLYDSESSPALLPNHADRPEVIAALAGGEGTAQRDSTTLGEVMLYHAVRLDDGTVIRLAQNQAGVGSILLSLLLPLLLIGLGFAVISFVVARRESARIIAPLEEVDLDHPVRNIDDAYAEMAPMLNRLESQRQELKRQMSAIEDSDRMRREFTANITHELKTPLTTVSGYAELMAGGMVASEDDVKEFSGRIYKEAGRLTALVNDILTLSNLDEAEHLGNGGAGSVMGSMEFISLPQLIFNVKVRLEAVAEKNNVELRASTAPAQAYGVARLIDEIVYNLASNAIRYNKPQGVVIMSCGTRKTGEVFVKVADSGIGIAPEEQQKVFERFYRVDKSRSKARGGTGLGLAIVKHAAVLHGASIDLQSQPGEGTAITIVFPAQ